MVSWTKIAHSVLNFISRLGGNSLTEVIKGRNSREEATRAARMKILEDAKWLARKFESTAYPLMGDFRKDMRFLSVVRYLESDLIQKTEALIICQDLPEDSDSKTREEQIALYEEIAFTFKKNIVDLEADWFSNPN